MAHVKIEEKLSNITLFNLETLQGEFAPWKRQESGEQVYIKFTRGDEIGLLYVGEHSIMDADIQQGIMRLVNESWNLEGQLSLSFEGKGEVGIDPYVYQDPITIELGRSLLTLVDPQCKAPLLTNLSVIRDDIAHEIGIVPAGVKVKDNLKLEPEQYRILLKNTPIAQGELFLDRYLAVGDFDTISQLIGWAAVEPVFKVQGKWIEPEFREKASAMGCTVLGSLQVILTHIKSVIISSSAELLGLQDTHNLISRLRLSHPVVVDDFLENRQNLRKLRSVLQLLLEENVPINDLITILEVVGEHLEAKSVPSEIAEACRLALRRQICFNYLNEDGELRGLVFHQDVESELSKASIRLASVDEEVSEELADNLVSAVRKALTDNRRPPAVFVNPVLRPIVRRILATSFPRLAVISTSELPPNLKVVINGAVKFVKKPEDESCNCEECQQEVTKETKNTDKKDSKDKKESKK